MMYLLMIFMLCCCYYTVTYGVSLWRKDRNKLGGSAIIFLGVFGTLIPVLIMFLKS